MRLAWFHARTAALSIRIETSSARTQWLAVFVPLLGVYLATLRTGFAGLSADPIAVTPSAWSLAHHGTPQLPAHLWPSFIGWDVPGSHDTVVSNRAPGLVLIAAPLYLLFHTVGPHQVWPASIAAALVTAAAMGTLAVLLRRLVSARAALAGAFVAGLASSTWAVSGTAIWPHGPDQLALVGAMLFLASGSTARSGLALAAAALLRPPLAVVAAVMGVAEAHARRRWRPILALGATCAVGLGGYLLYARVFWGGGIDSAYTAVGRGFTPGFFDASPAAWARFAENIVGTIFAPGRGVLLGSPFLLTLLPGLRAGWVRAPRWVKASALGGVGYLLIVLKANRFGGGENFWSYRYPIETLTLAAPLLVLAWREWTVRTPRRRASFAALVTVSISLQAVGALCFHVYAAGSPWSIDHLAAAVFGRQGRLAGTLLLSGAAIGIWLYVRGRNGSPGSAVTDLGSDVLDVARADDALPGARVDPQPAVPVDVHRGPAQHPAVDPPNQHVLAERGARGPVGGEQAGRLGVAAHLVPALQPAVQPVQHGDEHVGAVEVPGPAQAE